MVDFDSRRRARQRAERAVTDWSIPKRLAAAAGLAALCTLGYWCVADMWFGEWRSIRARVTGRQFVPDHSHWVTDVYACGTTEAPQTCTSMRYVSLPAEFHVFVIEPDGARRDIDDAWGFSNLREGGPVTLKARVGRSGIRWMTIIDREKSKRTNA